ncbi:hypothetical protein F4782DRAFT_493674 [Xylaria castorea]|nr:hypothetical protein F4782DRAFT_493674 [Xylaria castorea]
MGDTERYVLLPMDELETPVKKTSANRTKLCALSTRLNITLFVALVASLVAIGVIIHRAEGFPNHSYYNLVQATYNSPVAKELQSTWKTVLLQTAPIGSPEGVYRQAPDDAVDAAWAALGEPPMITLSGAEVRDLGKDPTEVARPPEDWGLGPDVYLGTIDVYHQLHCLDLLRMNLRDNFNHYHPNPQTPFARAHLSHCIGALMKTLMCQPSLDILTAAWVDLRGFGPMHLPDFDINRKCMDFEQVHRWKEGRRVDITEAMMKNATPPVGTKFLQPSVELQEAVDGMWGGVITESLL